jgi:hypothetical protein
MEPMLPLLGMSYHALPSLMPPVKGFPCSTAGPMASVPTLITRLSRATTRKQGTLQVLHYSINNVVPTLGYLPHYKLALLPCAQLAVPWQP